MPRPRSDGLGPQSSYNIARVRALLYRANKLCRSFGRYLFCPKEVKAQILGYYYEVYMEMYDYMTYRIRRNSNVDENTYEDIAQDIFWYLLARGEGFFKEAHKILANDFVPWNKKFMRIQRVLDGFIYSFAIKYSRKMISDRVVEEENMDAQLIADLTRTANPENIAMARYEREAVVNMLLTAPPFCRIDKDVYEREARIFFKKLYKKVQVNSVKSTNTHTRQKFYKDYVVYCIRKLLESYKINADDISDYGVFDIDDEPTLSQILADKLGIKNTFKDEAVFTPSGKLSEYNEKKRRRELEHFKNEQDNPKFLILN